MDQKKKYYKGEKYIYLLMAIRGCQQNNEKTLIVGEDNGMVGGQNYQRKFTLTKYDGKDLLQETKTSKGFADFSRVFEIWGIEDNKPTIMDYMNETNENGGQNWTH